MAQQQIGSLSQAQCQSYWDDGYLFPLPVLSEQSARHYRAQLELIEATNDAQEKPRSVKEYLRTHSEMVVPMAAELATNASVVDCVESILGENVLVWSAEFFIKEPCSEQIVTMHQDLTYWGFGETSNQVTAWIALSESSIESGCMALVKGSHKNPILPHDDTHATNNMLSRGQEVQVDVAEEDKVHLQLQPGEMSLHHGLAIHGSAANRSIDRRIGFAIRYVNPEAGRHLSKKHYAMLARGEDSNGLFNLYQPPASLFDADALTTYETVREHLDSILSAGMEGEKVLFS